MNAEREPMRGRKRTEGVQSATLILDPFHHRRLLQGRAIATTWYILIR